MSYKKWRIACDSRPYMSAMPFLNRLSPVKRGRRFYFTALCVIVIVLFTVAHWRSLTILMNETRDQFGSTENMDRRFKIRGGSRHVAMNLITDAICSSKGFLYSARCHKGILGVSKSDIEKYQPSMASQFVCLDSTHHRISWSAVNDDYCDCNDGSDEPGTGACPKTRFYCSPQGKYIPSSRINDGICDCCDGSDEWKSLTVGNDVLTHHNIDITYSPCKDVCIGKDQ